MIGGGTVHARVPHLTVHGPDDVAARAHVAQGGLEPRRQPPALGPGRFGKAHPFELLQAADL